MSTQATLKDLGDTVHSSVIGNPANGFVKEEDSKEYALEGGALLLSPTGSMHTAVYSDYSHDSDESDLAQALSAEAVRGLEEEEKAVKTPAKSKTVLPKDYDASSGHTPPGWQGTWQEVNARCWTPRPMVPAWVPGHTASPSVPPGPFFVDTPPSCK